jgi:hypothetical protein
VVQRPLAAVLLENETAYLVDAEQAAIFLTLITERRKSGWKSHKRRQGYRPVVDLHHRVGFPGDAAHLRANILDEGRRSDTESFKLCLGGIVETSATNRDIGVARIDLIFQIGITVAAQMLSISGFRCPIT